YLVMQSLQPFHRIGCPTLSLGRACGENAISIFCTLELIQHFQQADFEPLLRGCHCVSSLPYQIECGLAFVFKVVVGRGTAFVITVGCYGSRKKSLHFNVPMGWVTVSAVRQQAEQT